MEIPPQSPLYRSIQKDRYSRQEKIIEIENLTGRKLIVYITNMNHPLGFINRDDIAPFADLLQNFENVDLDLLLQSLSGDIYSDSSLNVICHYPS